MSRRTVRVANLARVEGEGALHLVTRSGRITDLRLELFEPPRFFEALLRGRSFMEAPDLTARVCGICPVAYQMSAVHALESALEIQVERPIRDLRRLIYCGEWIESHALHIHLLHAPDFLGYDDAVAMAADHPEEVQRGLRLKKAGNELVRVIGGREVHPINVRVGGFYRMLARDELLSMREELLWARDAALETLHWLGTFSFPDFAPDYTFVSLRHPDEYPMTHGRLASSAGLDIGFEQFEDYVVEEQVPYSTALHAVLRDSGTYLTGPLARYNLNFDRLSQMARDAAGDAGLGSECRNPFRSILVRGVEVLYACDEALRIIERYHAPEHPYVQVAPRQAEGSWCTEAPRGVLYHRYRIDEEGTVLEANIMPPTSQNQKRIEEDLRQYLPAHLDLPKDQLTLLSERLIRNHDPCISCATHFLTIDLSEAAG